MHTQPTLPQRDWPFYLIAACCGIGVGCIDVVLDDLLFTALLVVASCMVLGLLQPHWPWRWVAIVGAFIPLTELAAFWIRSIKPARAQIFGSFLAFLPGVAGAYGGSIVRKLVNHLREGT